MTLDVTLYSCTDNKRVLAVNPEVSTDTCMDNVYKPSSTTKQGVFAAKTATASAREHQKRNSLRSHPRVSG